MYRLHEFYKRMPKTLLKSHKKATISGDFSLFLMESYCKINIGFKSIPSEVAFMRKNAIRHSIRRTFALLSIVLILTALCACKSRSTKELEIGTGGEKGTYYAYMSDFAKIMQREYTITPRTTAGSAASVRLLQKGFVDGAVVQDDILEQAYNGLGVFANEKTANNLTFSAVASLYTESLQIIVRADSDIHSVKDLKGKRVSIGESESGVIVEAEQVLAIYGLTFKDLEVHNNSFASAAAALKSDNLDAFFCVAGAPTKAVSDLAKETDIRILSLDEEEINKLKSLYPYYESVTLPIDTYGGIDTEVRTIGVRAIFVVSNSCSDDDIYSLTKALLAHSAELNESIITDGETSIEDATKNVSVPFHPGAARYYEENGITVPVGTTLLAKPVSGTQD